MRRLLLLPRTLVPVPRVATAAAAAAAAPSLRFSSSSSSAAAAAAMAATATTTTTTTTTTKEAANAAIRAAVWRGAKQRDKPTPWSEFPPMTLKAAVQGTLHLYPREVEGTKQCAKLRDKGQVPGTVYGGKPNRYGLVSAFAVDLEAEMRRRGAAFTNSLYVARIATGQEQPALAERLVVPRHVEVNPLTGHLVSVAFMEYNPLVGAVVNIPISLTDTEKSPGLKRGGVLVRSMFSVPVLVRGLTIPTSFEISLAGMDVGHKATWATHVKLPPPHVCEIKLRVNPNVVARDPKLTLLAVRGSRNVVEEAETAAGGAGSGGEKDTAGGGAAAGDAGAKGGGDKAEEGKGGGGGKK